MVLTLDITTVFITLQSRLINYITSTKLNALHFIYYLDNKNVLSMYLRYK